MSAPEQMSSLLRPARGERAEASRHPLGRETGLRLEELADHLASRIRQRPVAAVAIAIVIGFAAGGAFTSRAGRMAIASAARHAVRELLKQLV